MSVLKEQLGGFFERVRLDDGVFDTMYYSFEEEYKKAHGQVLDPPSGAFDTWLVKNAGIINDIDYPIWQYFYVVDRRLFTIAMLKYS